MNLTIQHVGELKAYRAALSAGVVALDASMPAIAATSEDIPETAWTTWPQVILSLSPS